LDSILEGSGSIRHSQGVAKRNDVMLL